MVSDRAYAHTRIMLGVSAILIFYQPGGEYLFCLLHDLFCQMFGYVDVFVLKLLPLHFSSLWIELL